MRHAYMIIAHGKWEQLICLLKQIDCFNNDIYIHIDKKAKDVPIKKIEESVKISNIKIFREYSVYWGSFELVQTEIFLMKKASENKYDYYHLLSGMDLLIKSKKEIEDFFNNNKGYEYIHFDTEERLKKDKEIARRTQCYHFLTNYRRRYKSNFLNNMFTLLERCSLIFQIIIGINRNYKYKDFEIKYGSQWFSITHDFVQYVLEKEEWVYFVFKHTKCADELFMQSLIYNSPYKEKLYNKKFDDDNMSNLRLIDLKERGHNGSPYTWKITDLDEIKNSSCMYGRKFDLDEDIFIVKQK